MMLKPNTAGNYQRRLDKVVDYIYKNLDEDIPIDRLAEVANFSAFHWHRIYTAMRGETVTQTVRRLRLQRAADRLANSDSPVADVARQAGFSAVESFGRAFKAAYDQAPAAYRSAGSHAGFKAAMAARDQAGFEVSIQSRPAVHCAAIVHRGSYMQIDQAMGQLFSELGRRGLLSDPPAMMAVFPDDANLVAEEHLRSMACSPVHMSATLEAPLQALTLAAGEYAVLRYKGPYADMKDAYRWFYGVWLPGSRREPAGAPALELYCNDPRSVPATELLTDVCLLLEPQA